MPPQHGGLVFCRLLALSVIRRVATKMVANEAKRTKVDFGAHRQWHE